MKNGGVENSRTKQQQIIATHNRGITLWASSFFYLAGGALNMKKPKAALIPFPGYFPLPQLINFILKNYCNVAS